MRFAASISAFTRSTDAGTLDFQVYFNQVNEFLPGAGDLQIQVYDSDGTLIAGNGPNFGINNGFK